MDLRQFIACLENAGELDRITEEVDWKYEIGERSRAAQQPGYSCKALLFENVKDYPGHRVLTNGLSSYSKVAIAMGLEDKPPFTEIVGTFKKRLSQPEEPVLADESPLHENVLTGADVNLLKLPIPWWSREDGGRYVGTWHLNVTKDPENKACNLGVYRMQLLGENRTALSFSPKSHLAIQLNKAESKGKSLEMAVAIGGSELVIMAAAAAPPYGMNEYHLAGGLCQKPVSLAKCHTVDLEVPALSEIVLEGHILANERIEEGPFLDYSGFPSSDAKASVFEVSCISHRNNPVFRGAAIGLPGAEDHLLFSILSAAGCLDFHGSRIRQAVQNKLLKRSHFTLFQQMGKIKKVLRSKT